jgi:hypothetical protein
MGIEIDKIMLSAFDEYHTKSLAMQKYLFEGNESCITKQELEKIVDDDLIFNVPIYDVLDRKYAAFSSFLEAIDKKDTDPKGNGKFFKSCYGLADMESFDVLALFYLFRLCGSGINYMPNSTGNPLGSHGFGNFWVVNSILNGRITLDEWLEDLKDISCPFTDSKGYLLPMISYKHLSSGHMKHFILSETKGIIKRMIQCTDEGCDRITDFVDEMNGYIMQRGFKRQTFVLSATAADIAEYTDRIDKTSMIYAGTNAKKCINILFKKKSRMQNVEFESECIAFLADRYSSVPYSVEDSRLCDVHRYLNDYQSAYHIAANGGKTYSNNSILKMYYTEDEYLQKLKQLG